MEDTKYLLVQNDACLLSSSDENDVDSESLSSFRSKYNWEGFNRNESLLEINYSNSLITKKRNGERRLPTRRPDPNVYNRNALLARENRRKKKVYLETIEKELLVARKANRALAKALKRQLTIAHRLEEEKKYLESLVTNRSKVVTYISGLNCNDFSESDESPFSTTSSNADYINTNVRYATSSRSLSSTFQDAESLSIGFDSPSDGSVTAPIDSALCDYSSFDFCTFPEFFTDLDNCADSSLPTTSTTWDDIWGDKGYDIDNLISPNLTILQTNNVQQSFHDDHCYVSKSKVNNITNPEPKCESIDYVDVGEDCSHIGKSCSSCNWNPACRTPPLQLFSDQF